MLNFSRRCDWRTLLASAFAAMLWTLPAGAANVDFDGDGVPDDVRITTQFRPEILITVSTSRATHVLHLREAPVAVVAIDLDHDGLLDLSALSPRHRLRFWLNKGRFGFFRIHPKRLPTKAPAFHNDGPLLNRTAGDGTLPEQTGSSSPVGIECSERSDSLPPVGIPLDPARSTDYVLHNTTACTSRAPPESWFA